MATPDEVIVTVWSGDRLEITPIDEILIAVPAEYTEPPGILVVLPPTLKTPPLKLTVGAGAEEAVSACKAYGTLERFCGLKTLPLILTIRLYEPLERLLVIGLPILPIVVLNKPNAFVLANLLSVYAGETPFVIVKLKFTD